LAQIAEMKKSILLLSSIPWPMLVFILMGPIRQDTIASPAPGNNPLTAVWEKPQVLNGIWKIRPGDSAAWAQAGYDDAHWDSARLANGLFREIVTSDGYSWYRFELGLPPRTATGKLLGLLHPPAASQEYYWDGELIGRTGRVGASKAEERSGDVSLTEIPERLSGPGRHVLAIRMSAHHPILYPNSMQMTLGEFTTLHLGSTREMIVMFFLAGVFVFAAIYRFLNYRASGYGRNTLLFSVCVLSAAAYIVFKHLGFITHLDAGQLLAVRLALSVAWYLMISLVPDYFIFAESFPYRWLLPVLLIGGLIVAVPMGFVYTGYAPLPWMAPIYSANQIFVYLSMTASLWVIGWAVWRKQTGSGLALPGLLSMMTGITVTWMFQIEWAWAAGIAAHVIFLARAQSHQMSERIRRHQEMDLHSARLEIELLKKNIQPHFLLNSLNSIIAWLEEEPRSAARLVNALAEELGMLLRISSLKTISLDEEIRLCRTHLQVMGLRQDKSYSLEHSGVRGDERIPPMVLHTLVENGLTHGYIGKTTGSFLLKREELPESVRYSLFNDGVPREKKEKKAEGTGLRYVRTRLEEVFPGRWSLESRSVENGWEVTMDIKRESR
jgi:sensor histidine kinase YesM